MKPRLARAPRYWPSVLLHATVFAWSAKKDGNVNPPSRQTANVIANKATVQLDKAGTNALFGAEPRAYAAVFAAQALAFLVAAGLAIRMDPVKRQHVQTPVPATAIH